MRQILSAFVLFCTLVDARAQAKSDPLSAFYENTWKVYSATGVDYYFVNRDHTWVGVEREFKTPEGRTPSGIWRIESGKVCFHHLKGDPHPKDDCLSILGKKVGVPWKLDVDSGDELIGIIDNGRELYPKNQQ